MFKADQLWFRGRETGWRFNTRTGPSGRKEQQMHVWKMNNVPSTGEKKRIPWTADSWNTDFGENTALTDGILIILWGKRGRLRVKSLTKTEKNSRTTHLRWKAVSGWKLPIYFCRDETESSSINITESELISTHMWLLDNNLHLNLGGREVSKWPETQRSEAQTKGWSYIWSLFWKERS